MVATTSDRLIYLDGRPAVSVIGGVLLRHVTKASHFWHGNRDIGERGWGFHREILEQAADTDLLAVLYRPSRVLFVAEREQAVEDTIPLPNYGFGRQDLIPLTAWQCIAGVPANAGNEVIANLCRRKELWRPVPPDWQTEARQLALPSFEEERA